MSVNLLNIKRMVDLYKRLMLLQISPEAMPYSPALLARLIGCYVLINLLKFVYMLKGNWFFWLFVLLLSVGSSIAYVYALLKKHEKTPRLHKILLAIFGTDVCFSILSMLLTLILAMLKIFNINIQIVVAFFIMLWSLAVKTHIFEKGLNFGKLYSMASVIGFELARYLPIVMLLNLYFVK